jgi:hypothetical protein
VNGVSCKVSHSHFAQRCGSQYQLQGGIERENVTQMVFIDELSRLNGKVVIAGPNAARAAAWAESTITKGHDLSINRAGAPSGPSTRIRKEYGS